MSMRRRSISISQPANAPTNASNVVELRNVNEGLLISALREQELAATLETERAQLEVILSSIGDAVLVVDQEGKPVRTNAAYIRMMGDPESTILPRDASGRPIAPSDTPWLRAARGDDFELEFSMLAPDGTLRWWEAIGRPIGRGPSSQGGVVVFRDISARKQFEKALHHEAMHDGLTRLPNRTLLYDRLEQALMAAQRTKLPVALLLLDLDHFKEVNDTFGHQAGDALLREIAARLLHTIRAADTAARLGGDEFTLLLPGTNCSGAMEVADRVLESLHSNIMIEGQAVKVGVSIGIALASDQEVDAPMLLKQADIAMYEAKRTQGGYVIYTDILGTESGRT
jgi:diguanylate cyclase (GGDEF)-like protein/PAS domain S-box-containing protein